MTRSVSNPACFLALVVTVGCAGSAQIESKKSAGYEKKLERVLVAVELGRVGAAFEKAFKERFVEALKTRGAEARFAILEDDFEVERAPSMEKQASEFRASSLLLLRKTGGVVNQFGQLMRADYDGQLFDLALKTRVWRARITYTPGGKVIPVEHRADVLIDEVLDALATDGLIEGPRPPVAAAGRQGGERTPE